MIDEGYNVRVGYWASRNNMQSLCHSDMDVQLNFREQLATSSWRQSMASQIDKLQLLDPFITPRKMYVGDKQSESIFIGGSLMQKMGLKMEMIHTMTRMSCLF